MAGARKDGLAQRIPVGLYQRGGIYAGVIELDRQ